MFPDFDQTKFTEADKTTISQVLLNLQSAEETLENDLSEPARGELENTLTKLEDLIVDLEFALDRYEDPGYEDPGFVSAKELTENEKVFQNAMNAYFRKHGFSAPQPSYADSTPETIDGKLYMVLRNVNGVLAVAQVYDTRIRLLDEKDWPKGIK